MLGRSFGFKIRLAAKSIDNELSAPNDGSKIFSMPTKFINRIFHLFPSLFVHAGMSFVLTTKRQRWKQQKLLVPIVFHFLIFFPPIFHCGSRAESFFPVLAPCQPSFHSLNYETKHKSLNKIIISATEDRGRARSSGKLTNCTPTWAGCHPKDWKGGG